MNKVIFTNLSITTSKEVGFSYEKIYYIIGFCRGYMCPKIIPFNYNLKDCIAFLKGLQCYV